MKLLEKFEKQVSGLLKKAQKDGLLGTPAPKQQAAEVDQSTVERNEGPATTETNSENAVTQENKDKEESVSTLFFQVIL